MNICCLVGFFITFAISFISGSDNCSGCVRNPPPMCYVWPMQAFEVKLMSPFCEEDQLCYIVHDLAYSWTKCVGFCSMSETLPGNNGTFGLKICEVEDCQCCQATQVEKMEVCIVCCKHRLCSNQGVAALLPGGTLGQARPNQSGSSAVLSKEEVERRAREQYMESQRLQANPVVESFIRPFFYRGLGRSSWSSQGGSGRRRTSRPPTSSPNPRTTTGPTFPPSTSPQDALPDTGALQCSAWYQKKIYDVPRQCSCQPCA